MTGDIQELTWADQDHTAFLKTKQLVFRWYSCFVITLELRNINIIYRIYITREYIIYVITKLYFLLIYTKQVLHFYMPTNCMWIFLEITLPYVLVYSWSPFDTGFVHLHTSRARDCPTLTASGAREVALKYGIVRITGTILIRTG